MITKDEIDGQRPIRTMVPPEEWMVRLWPQIRAKVQEIGGWFCGYTKGTYSAFEKTGFPLECPEGFHGGHRIPDDLRGFPRRTVTVRNDMVVPFREFGIDSFMVFRVPNEVHKRLNEGYEDTAGTENERFIADGPDHTVVVYMT